MSLFKKDARGDLEKLIARDREDRQQLEALQSKLEGLLPEWERIQEQCEYLHAIYQNQDGCYDRGVCESFWSARGPKLKQQLLELIDQRDALTRAPVAEIAATKKRIFLRHSRVASGFASWSGQIAAQLPRGVQTEIFQAARDVQKMEDLTQVFETIEDWIARIAESDEAPTSPPLLNLGRLVRETVEKDAA